MTKQSIGKDKAIAMYESEWWIGLDAKRIAQVQLFIDELCMPFGRFHAAMDEALGRPVYTHEFGLNYAGLIAEFLGTHPPPTMQEIIDLIPEDKRIVL